MANGIGIDLTIMHGHEISGIVEPANYCLSMEMGWFTRNTGYVAAPRILHGMLAEAMMHGVVMDIHH